MHSIIPNKVDLECKNKIILYIKFPKWHDSDITCLGVKLKTNLYR